MTGRSKSGVSCHFWQVSPNRRLTAVCLRTDASSLALVAEKTNAHNGYVLSVGYDKDGGKIVSGGQDGTIKVWDTGACSGST